METGLWFWIAFLAFTGALLAFDLGVLHRRDHVIRVREVLFLSLFYIALALLCRRRPPQPCAAQN